MKRKKTRANSPLIRLVGLEAAAAAAAASLAGSPAMAAPGDLDPSFGDVGRQMDLPNASGTLWSVDAQDDHAVLFGGGDDYCYYSCYEDYFVGRLLPDGTPDAGFVAPALEATVVYDTSLQADGKVIGVGHVRRPDGIVKLQVFRLLTDGSLDPAFGLGGLVLVADTTDDTEIGRSVLVEPDGRIVVAGTRGSRQLLVARLLANGAPDPTFGVDGVVVWQPAQSAGTIARYATSPTQVAKAAGGGYRVMGHEWRNDPVDGYAQGCSVLGLTEAGTLDVAFGDAGLVGPEWGVLCSALAVDPDGRLLLGSTAGDDGKVRRMLASGQADPAFQTTAVPDQLSTVTALALGATGSIFVAGQDHAGQSGATVLRLLDNGSLDAQYGRAGAAAIDLRTYSSIHPVIQDMQARDAGALVIGGSFGWWGTPFVARLLGDAAGGGPGVLSLQQDRVTATEADGQAVLTVRRVGGSTGAVAVTYTARDTGTGAGYYASAGQDYTAVTGRLSWADGETDEREIIVPIASDTLAESPEFFEVVLDAPEGGAGLGTFGSGVEIAGEGYPAGRLTLGLEGSSSVAENGVARFVVNRNDYYKGVVTATVRVAGGDATPGVDFVSPGSTAAWQDVVVTFQDGESQRQVNVSVLADKRNEKPESFTLELVAPTGGAVLGSGTQATVQIQDTNTDSGGGGSFGWLSGLLLGLGGALRRRLLRSR